MFWLLGGLSVLAGGLTGAGLATPDTRLRHAWALTGSLLVLTWWMWGWGVVGALANALLAALIGGMIASLPVVLGAWRPPGRRLQMAAIATAAAGLAVSGLTIIVFHVKR